MSIKNLVEMIKHNGLLASISQLEELYRVAIDIEQKLADSEARCAALAAESAGLKAAFDKPQAYLSWHAIPPTWEDPLPCGEYLDVHDEAGHKNSDGTDCWPVYAKPEIETPATDAFLAEVRAQGVEMLTSKLQSLIDEGNFEGDEIGVIAGAVYTGADIAAQLRKGVQS